MLRTPSRVEHFVLRFRRLLSVVVQLLLVVAANRVAFWLRFDGASPPWAVGAFWQALPWLVVIRGLTFVPFQLYEGLWRYTSIYDLQALLGGVSLSSLLFYLFTLSPFGPQVYPRSIFVTDAILLTMMLGGIRLTRRLVAEFGVSRHGKRVLIFGAGDAGELIVRDMKSSRAYAYQPIGFLDDDVKKVGRRIHGVRVLGTRRELRATVEEHRPDEVLIAIPGANVDAIRSIVRALEPFNIPIKTLPNLRDIIDGKVELSQIRSLSLEDLLARAPVGLDTLPLRLMIEGRRVLVTGAGGSIGSELCRQIARLRPSNLLMLDRYENSLHDIRMELDDQKNGFGVTPIIADVTDQSRVDAVLAQHRPEIVFHAAAHKHVPLMEENPCEAVKNNVRGTRILAAAAEACGVHRFIMISTDKAVNPTSVMGATKRIAELVVQAQALGSGTAFSIVRFGNVLGSNGSVVPRFVEQIRRGGPVTVTHPDVKRFFMLIPEAVQLVLHAAAHADYGATYVLEMGEQVKLLDMARDLIRLSGFAADDIRIEFTGLRPGEKLYEELVGPNEDAAPSHTAEIQCVRSRQPPSANLMTLVEHLEADAALGRVDLVRASLAQLAGLSGQTPSADRTYQMVANAATPVVFNRIDDDSHTCPDCGGRALRSRTRAVHERVYKHFTSERPFRCSTCGWRGWRELRQPAPVSLDPVTPLDLSTLDRFVGPPAAATRRPFSPRNLS